MGGRKRSKPRKAREDVPRVAPTEAPTVAPSATRSRHETTLGHWTKECRQP
jgi:hypothetical protein